MLLCVFFGLIYQVWNYFEYFFLCKTYFVFEILKGECLKILILRKLGLKLVFWKNISSHSYAFYSLYSMLCGVFSKISLFFSKILFFPYFRLIQSVFNQLKFLLKFSMSFCLFNQSKLIFDQSKIVNELFKKLRFDLFKHLFQNFSKPFSLSLTQQRSTEIFLSFSSKFLAKFLSP